MRRERTFLRYTANTVVLEELLAFVPAGNPIRARRRAEYNTRKPVAPCRGPITPWRVRPPFGLGPVLILRIDAPRTARFLKERVLVCREAPSAGLAATR